MRHIIQITIDTADATQATAVRNEIVGAIEDFVESKRPAFDIAAGELEVVESDRHRALIELATDRYGDEAFGVSLDTNARLSEGKGGVWVQGWLWLDQEILAERGLAPLPEAGEGRRD